mmetsp:Transcript_46983/g.134386  ORF Transcript_46983/g.134386 Transcript_46983/m.134386 type:complete len:222 (+) Transcript_46983:66-731(+)
MHNCFRHLQQQAVSRTAALACRWSPEPRRDRAEAGQPLDTDKQPLPEPPQVRPPRREASARHPPPQDRRLRQRRPARRTKEWKQRQQLHRRRRRRTRKSLGACSACRPHRQASVRIRRTVGTRQLRQDRAACAPPCELQQPLVTRRASHCRIDRFSGAVCVLGPLRSGSLRHLPSVPRTREAVRRASDAILHMPLCYHSAQHANPPLRSTVLHYSILPMPR